MENGPRPNDPSLANQNPYAPPAAEAPAARKTPHAESDLERLRAALPRRRGAFAFVLTLGGSLYGVSGAGALATSVAEGATVTSPALGIAIGALGFGLPLALLGGLLATRVRLAQFIAFPLTLVCGGISVVGFLFALRRANELWGIDDAAPTFFPAGLALAFFGCSLATGWFFHRAVMTLARAGAPIDEKS